MSKNLTAMLGVLCFALASGSLYLVRQLDRQQDLNEAEIQKREQSEARLKEMQERFAKLERSYASEMHYRAASTTDSVKQSAAASSPHSYSTGFETPRPTVYPAGGMRANGSPIQRVNVEMAKYLKLSDGQAAKILQILSDDQKRTREWIEQHPGQTLDKQMTDAWKAETDRQLLELLGEEKFKDYTDYKQYTPEHQRINLLNLNLADSGVGALTQDQEHRLFDALKEEKNRIPQPASAQYGSQEEFFAAAELWRQSYIDRSQDRARTILTPEQQTVFQSLRPNGPARFRRPPAE